MIDMYTNSFLSVIGKYLYEEFTKINEKTVKKGVKLLQVLLDTVLPEISIVKIRTSLLCLFSPLIPSRMKKALESKKSFLETKYWIP